MQDQNKTKDQLLAEIASLKESLTDQQQQIEDKERFYNLFRDSAVSMVVIMPDGRFTQANKAFCDFLGYSEPELLGMTVLSITHPDDLETTFRMILQSFGSGPRIQRLEKRYLHKSGQIVWGEVTTTMICDSDGTPNSAIAQVLDINERKRAEEALRLSEAKYRRLHESMMDAFDSVNMDGFIEEFNEAYCQMLGYEPDEIRKLRYTDITPEKWHPFEAEIVAKQVLTRGYSEIYEKEYRRKDGTIFPVEMRTILVKNDQDQPIAMWSIVRDITERKKAVEALRNNERRLTTLISNLPGMAYRCMIDRNWTMEFISDGCVLLTGYTSTAFTGNHEVAYGDIIHPDDRERVWNEVQQAIAESRHFQLEYRIHTASGEEKWVWEQGVAIYSDSGKVEALEGLMTDITGRKRAEEALKKAHDELERRVEERTAELVKANKELDIHRLFADASTQGFGIADLNGYIRYLNPAMCRILGEKRIEEVIGKPFFKYGRSLEYMKDEFLPTLFREGRWEKEGLVRTPQGKSVPVWHNSFLIRDACGQPAYIATTLADITERKQAEVTLRQSRDQLQAIYDGMSDGLLIADIETKRFVRANASMCKMLGYSESELLTKSVSDIHPPEALPFVIEQFQGLVEGKLRVSEDVPVLRKDGSVFYAMVSSSKVVFDDRHCVVGFFRDSTERKKAQEALQQSEEQFRSYFEQGLLGMAISASDMRWLEVNDRFCSMIGCSREEALQRKIIDFIHPDDREAFLRSYRQLLTGETESYEAERRYLLKNGKVLYLNIFVKAFRSEKGTPNHILALHEDVTERKQVQEALRQSHDELRLIYEEMEDGIVILDFENPHPLQANAAICRMLGYSKEELKAVSPIHVHPPEAMPKIQDHFAEVARGKVARFDNMPFLRRDGIVIYADVASSRIFFNGRFCRISFIHDVTEQKLSQEALQREHRTLKHLLQSSDHERQTIAYEIHDGLAQYLAAAIMQFDVAKSQREKKPNEATKAYDAATTLLRQGHSEARRLIAGIRHPVLDEAGVVEAVAHLINEQNREAGPKIEFRSLVDFSRLVPLLENAIYRIIQEGMTNACKYSQSSRVRITLLQQKDRLRIEIRDWGIGFDTTNVKEGSYGLTGIRERARLLGGKYRLQSAAGKGTRIVVELPLMEREE